MRLRVLLLAATVAFLGLPAVAGEVSVAVAANFTAPAEKIGAAFKAATGHDAVFSFGASGGLYTQVTQGAPFEVFLSADAARPAQVVTDGLGVEGSVFTYAVGTLALYSPSIDVTDAGAVLRAGDFRHIAIGDPATAPYGAAAMETMAALGVIEALTPKLVTGQNITQALQFVESGSAEIGFVALSQVIDRPATHVWRVPGTLHAPIHQDAVLLKTGADNPAATAFIAFLRGDEARAIIERFGYEPGAAGG